MFHIHQTEELIILRIRLPYVKISSAELTVDKNRILFHLQPYFLDLHLPNELSSEGVQSAVYDHNDSHLTVKIAKKIPGEHFKDLDLMAALMKPAKPVVPKLSPKIELLSETNEIEELNQAMEELSISATDTQTNRYTYGFNNGHSKVFVDLKVN